MGIRQTIREFLASIKPRRNLGRVMLAAGFILLVGLILPRTEVQVVHYRKGMTWDRPDLRAPFAFPIHKTQSTYEAEVEETRKRVPNVFLQQPKQQAKQREALRQYMDQLQEALGDGIPSPRRAAWAEVQPLLVPAASKLNPVPSEAALRNLWKQQPGALTALRRQSLQLLDSLHSIGYINRSSETLSGPFISLRPSPSRERLLETGRVIDRQRALKLIQERARKLSSPVQQLFKRVLVAHAKPNFLYNEALHKEEMQHAAQLVSPFEGKVEAGEVIVSREERVDEETARMIHSLNLEKAQRTGQGLYWLRYLGQVFVVLMLTLVILQFLRLNRRPVYQKNNQLALLMLIYALVIGLVSISVYAEREITSEFLVNLGFAVPVAMAAILCTVFFDDRIGFFTAILVAIFGGLAVQSSFEFFLIHSLAGAVAVFNLKFLRNRAQFFSMAGLLLLTYVGTYLGYNLYLSGSLGEINYNNLLLFGFNIFLTLGTYPLVYLFERIFNLTSNFTYLELLDTEHPLLKSLALKAPGTYQHSLQVANIAEEAAKKVGANPLLVHAGALFHDIGKMYQPEYFVENQQPGQSPHANLSPHQSARIIIKHVDNGLDLARQHNLPDEIQNFIRTHHGTSRVEFFWQKYLKTEPDASPEAEADFRYKGRLPSTKEEAILMLADSVEAAARAMNEPTQEKLTNLVEKIVATKVNDNQLILAQITFRDLDKIKRTILKLLLSIYHSRIQYPDGTPPPANEADKPPRPTDPSVQQPSS